MAATDTSNGIFRHLDQLNEFERQPVTEDKLYGGGYFAGSFAGEHVAATEFVIGALFVKFGASAYDVLVGLIVGNLLAVLSWALVCAPIAVQTRLTLYWYLRKIAGPVVTVAYNVLNAILYCILAGAMITVSASAVRIPFGIPQQTRWYPGDVRFVLVVLVVGAVVVTLAIWGFKKLAQFASVCSPWMFLMFIAGGLVMLPTLGRIGSFSDFWKVASEQIWTGRTLDGSPPLGFWHVVAFAWICNLAMHLGLSDMAVLRYAKHAAYGFYSAFGMYLGHYLAWVCAGIMGAAVAAMPEASANPDSGHIAHQAIGVAGALAVVIAGWTTSNPTLYRAGLALQAVTPGWPRWLVTLAAGTITTVIACFPFVFTKLLDFVGLYGLLLMPVGAIVVVEHWIFPRIGFAQFWSSRKGLTFNWPALLAWAIPLLGAIACWQTGIIHLFFLCIPVWLLTAILYIVFAAMAGARQLLPELPEEIRSAAPPPTGDDVSAEPPAAGLYYFSGAVALVCLALCVVLPALVFAGSMEGQTFKNLLIWVTVAYFVSGTIWISQSEKRKSLSAG